MQLDMSAPTSSPVRACGFGASVRRTVAALLLMAQDRIQDDTVPLTHEFVSLILAVRRPGVMEALKALRQRGLISYRRGESR